MAAQSQFLSSRHCFLFSGFERETLGLGVNACRLWRGPYRNISTSVVCVGLPAFSLLDLLGVQAQGSVMAALTLVILPSCNCETAPARGATTSSKQPDPDQAGMKDSH